MTIHRRTSTLCCAVFLVAVACGDDASETSTPDARVAATVDAAPATPDAAPDAAVNTALERGRYLVTAVISCTTCHTPVVNGVPDTTRYLAGRSCFIDTSPPADNGMGCVNARNLTNHETGLKNYTDEQIKTMLTKGMKPDGKMLHATMPYWLFGLLTDADSSAIVTFLRTLPGVDNTVPANQPPWDNITTTTPAVTDSDVPAAGGTGATLESATRGRYLARVACMACHSPALNPPVPRPDDISKAFQGGRVFMNIPVQPTGIYSPNLTPDATGLMGWSVDDVVKVVKQGKDRADKGVCPPMPVGPMGLFANMTDADARDIATYVLNLTPVASSIPAQCSLP